MIFIIGTRSQTYETLRVKIGMNFMRKQVQFARKISTFTHNVLKTWLLYCNLALMASHCMTWTWLGEILTSCRWSCWWTWCPDILWRPSRRLSGTSRRSLSWCSGKQSEFNQWVNQRWLQRGSDFGHNIESCRFESQRRREFFLKAFLPKAYWEFKVRKDVGSVKKIKEVWVQFSTSSSAFPRLLKFVSMPCMRRLQKEDLLFH